MRSTKQSFTGNSKKKRAASADRLLSRGALILLRAAELQEYMEDYIVKYILRNRPVYHWFDGGAMARVHWEGYGLPNTGRRIRVKVGHDLPSE
jgi:hypothetical protein